MAETETEETENETIEKDDEIIRKHLPNGGEGLVEDSLFTYRELAAYLLAERSNMTWQEAAHEMGISYGTFSGKMGNNVESKKRRARATVDLIDLVEG